MENCIDHNDFVASRRLRGRQPNHQTPKSLFILSFSRFKASHIIVMETIDLKQPKCLFVEIKEILFYEMVFHLRAFRMFVTFK